MGVVRRIAMIGVVGVGLGCGLVGCESREQRTVGQVQREFAEAAVNGGAEAALGTLRAVSYEEIGYRLRDVTVEFGDAFVMHAESADILVEPATDTMRIKFNGVLWAAVEREGEEEGAGGGDGRLRYEAVRTTEAWDLGVDVVGL